MGQKSPGEARKARCRRSIMGIPQGKHTEKMIEKMIVGTPAYLCKRLSQDKPKHLLFFCVMAATGNSTAIFNLCVFVDCYLCQPCTHACVEAGKSWSFLSSGISKALDFIQNPDKLIIFKWPRTRSQASRRAAAERCGTVHGLTWPQLARSSQWKFTSCFFTMEIYG